MLFIYHTDTAISRVENALGEQVDFDTTATVSSGLQQIARKNPQATLVWCRVAYAPYLNIAALPTVFHHPKLLLSFDPNSSSFLGDCIGYVDESLFVNVNKKVRFPTWQMSSAVGMVHASVLLKLSEIACQQDLDYYLNSVAKVAMPKGLLCYSEPKLLLDQNHSKDLKKSLFVLFRFVQQHYKTRWVFLLFLNLLWYENKLPFLPFFLSFFYKKRTRTKIDLEDINGVSNKNEVQQKTIDVIIPTIGRKKYLHQVLKDLAKQTIVPQKVVVVEQNPMDTSVSELDYLTTESWPFKIKHIFTHQAGACNARNLALQEVESEWVFMADDDIVFEADFLENSFLAIEKYGVSAVSANCLRENEKNSFNTVVQWQSFGAGCSIVRSHVLKKSAFRMGYEFGYGEDTDFGMQIRNQGTDVLYLPEPRILHLKAPVGGFRTKPILAWQKDQIQPKPSPTVMLFQINHKTKQQNLGYKTILFFKYYQHQSIKNPYTYFLVFKKQWNKSLYWAAKLNRL
ncbi:glycosyltransferase family 2 protein [Flavobacterium crassostreae]|uniref:Glycosyl transferase n=1 Tax=Flavobacterium crassostreae TaxID=1763534 RepID=A0A1B9E3M6_9FLAO|nr:glycosyltransferase family A protein [Flavobacterium crassostreae]OCB76541.1 glycosyl transferase [Flavobacterium crassostreae]